MIFKMPLDLCILVYYFMNARTNSHGMKRYFNTEILPVLTRSLHVMEDFGRCVVLKFATLEEKGCN